MVLREEERPGFEDEDPLAPDGAAEPQLLRDHAAKGTAADHDDVEGT